MLVIGLSIQGDEGWWKQLELRYEQESTTVWN